MIGDPTTPREGLSATSNPATVWQDDELQDYLDERRSVVRYAMLQVQPTPMPNSGIMQFLDYYGTNATWESDAQLFGPAWQPLTPATADFLTGHWTFAASQLPPVRVVGKVYDHNAAAADVLEGWAGLLKLDFDFEAHLTRYLRSQKAKACLALAETYRSRSEASFASMVRSDIAPLEHPGFQYAGLAGYIT